MSKETKEWIKSLVSVVLLAIFIKAFIFDTSIVDGQSMDNTLTHGDRVFVNKIGLFFREPRYDEIIIFHPPVEGERNKLYIKRVIGIPGDLIEIQNGELYRNGSLVEEDYINQKMPIEEPPGSWTVQMGQLFVMGDNRERGASSDSRIFGPIDQSSVEGVATFIFYPFNDIGRI